MESREKEKFIALLEKTGALRQGEFILKDGSRASVFINMGAFGEGPSLWELASYYGKILNQEYSLDSEDLLFGPAYKGIPLVVALSLYLYREEDQKVSFAYNRKEAKEHGEATQDGPERQIVGKIESGRTVYLVDDVFTSGGTKWEMVRLLQRLNQDLKLEGLVVAVDRNPKGSREFEKETGIKVSSLVTLSEIETFLES